MVGSVKSAVESSRIGLPDLEKTEESLDVMKDVIGVIIREPTENVQQSFN